MEDAWKEKVDKLEAKLAETQGEAEEVLKELHEYKAVSAEVAIPLQEALQKKEDEVAKLEATCGELKAKIASLEDDEEVKKRKDLAESASVHQITIEDQKRQISALHGQIAELHKGYSEKFTKLESAVEEAKSETASVTTMLSAKTAETASVAARAAKAEREANAIKKTFEEDVKSKTDAATAALLKEKDDLAAQLDEERKSNLATIENTTAKINTELTQKDQHIETLQSTLKVKEEELEKMRQNEKANQNTIAQLKATRPSQVEKPKGAPGSKCQYLTNEAGWRGGIITSYQEKTNSYTLKDEEKGWVLENWPEVHVKITMMAPSGEKRAAPSQAAPDAKKAKTGSGFQVGEQVEALFEGKWFDCTIKTITDTACEVQWAEDGSFTPDLPISQIRRKPANAPAASPGGAAKKPAPKPAIAPRPGVWQGQAAPPPRPVGRAAPAPYNAAQYGGGGYGRGRGQRKY